MPPSARSRPAIGSGYLGTHGREEDGGGATGPRQRNFEREYRMTRVSRSRFLAVAVGAAFAVFACGGSSSNGSGTTANKGSFKIGVDLPQSRAAASSRLPTPPRRQPALQPLSAARGLHRFP